MGVNKDINICCNNQTEKIVLAHVQVLLWWACLIIYFAQTVNMQITRFPW